MADAMSLEGLLDSDVVPAVSGRCIAHVLLQRIFDLSGSPDPQKLLRKWFAVATQRLRRE